MHDRDVVISLAARPGFADSTRRLGRHKKRQSPNRRRATHCGGSLEQDRPGLLALDRSASRRLGDERDGRKRRRPTMKRAAGFQVMVVEKHAGLGITSRLATQDRRRSALGTGDPQPVFFEQLVDAPHKSLVVAQRSKAHPRVAV